MIKKEDKDGIIKHLTETLEVLKNRLSTKNWNGVPNNVVFDMTGFDAVDYIDHRLMDVTF